MDKKYLWVFLVFVILFGMGLNGCPWCEEEKINGIVVPPEPDPVEDAASVGGVDSNGNIVRDSVERMIAEEFGEDPVAYEKAMDYAIAEQRAMLEPTEENVEAYDRLIICALFNGDDQLVNEFSKIDDATADIEIRVEAYREAFGGESGTITNEGC